MWVAVLAKRLGRVEEEVVVEEGYRQGEGSGA